MKRLYGSSHQYKDLELEGDARMHARRSIVASRDIAVGEVISEDMIGHKLGEFAPTRTFKGHKGSVQKKVG